MSKLLHILEAKDQSIVFLPIRQHQKIVYFLYQNGQVQAAHDLFRSDAMLWVEGK